MKRVRCPDRAPLRDLNADGYSEARQGVMISGCTWDHDVLAIVAVQAIRAIFPKVSSITQCVSFVERNLDPFRGLVNGKLLAGETEGFDSVRAWRRTGLLVEIDVADLTRSRRWLSP